MNVMGSQTMGQQMLLQGMQQAVQGQMQQAIQGLQRREGEVAPDCIRTSVRPHAYPHVRSHARPSARPSARPPIRTSVRPLAHPRARPSARFAASCAPPNPTAALGERRPFQYIPPRTARVHEVIITQNMMSNHTDTQDKYCEHCYDMLGQPPSLGRKYGPTDARTDGCTGGRMNDKSEGRVDSLRTFCLSNYVQLYRDLDLESFSQMHSSTCQMDSWGSGHDHFFGFMNVEFEGSWIHGCRTSG